MDLMLYFAGLPLWLSVILFVVLPSVVAAFGPFVVRRMFSVESIAANNEVAGFKFATLGVVYAVLLGLAVISVWEKYSEADSAATEEAAALAAIDRLATGLPATEATALRGAVERYGRSVLNADWPAMREGRVSSVPLAALNDLYRATLAVTPNDSRGAAILDALLSQLDLVTESRRIRIGLAEGIVPGVVWLVLLIGAAMTIGFTFFFGLDNLRVQMLMTGMLSGLIFLSLFVALSINHPFAGASGIQPEAIERVLLDFAGPVS